MSVFIVSMTWSNENVVTLYIKEVPVMNDEFDFWGVGTNDRIKNHVNTNWKLMQV